MQGVSLRPLTLPNYEMTIQQTTFIGTLPTAVPFVGSAHLGTITAQVQVSTIFQGFFDTTASLTGTDALGRHLTGTCGLVFFFGTTQIISSPSQIFGDSSAYAVEPMNCQASLGGGATITFSLAYKTRPGQASVTSTTALTVSTYCDNYGLGYPVNPAGILANQIGCV